MMNGFLYLGCTQRLPAGMVTNPINTKWKKKTRYQLKTADSDTHIFPRNIYPGESQTLDLQLRDWTGATKGVMSLNKQTIKVAPVSIIYLSTRRSATGNKDHGYSLV